MVSVPSAIQNPLLYNHLNRGGGVSYFWVVVEVDLRLGRLGFDWELGLGQVEAQVVNLALNLTSTVFEAGVATGMIWQTGKSFGMNIHVGAGYVYGFSSVAVSGIMIRALLGVSYFL